MTSFLREIGDLVSEKIGNQTISFYTKGYNNLGTVMNFLKGVDLENLGNHRNLF